SLEALKVVEGSRRPAQALDERGVAVAECARRRLEIDQKVRHVYDRAALQQLGGVEDLKILSFEDRSLPLWKKVGLAARFAADVLRLRDQVCRRIAVLREEMTQQARTLPGFPVQLFVRSLERVGNILEGALGVGRKEGTTQRLQTHEADTLGYYLQDLNVARAREKLGRLAAEVGVALDAGQEAPLAQIDGQIVRGFLDLKRAYEQEQQSLRDLERRIADLEAVLEGAPDDFKYPPTVPPLGELGQLPEHVRGELEESLAEDIEGLISEHDRTTRL